ncbi:hypothetical protein KC340_g104 [Hortaea werneckii]|nr:hypothetical protein KC340_g104 [Hortaea werneckii]
MWPIALVTAVCLHLSGCIGVEPTETTNSFAQPIVIQKTSGYEARTHRVFHVVLERFGASRRAQEGIRREKVLWPFSGLLLVCPNLRITACAKDVSHGGDLVDGIMMQGPVFELCTSKSYGAASLCRKLLGCFPGWRPTPTFNSPS